MSNRKQKKEIDKAVRNIISFAEKDPKWQLRLEATFSEMLEPAAQLLGIEDEELAANSEEVGYSHMIFGYIFEYFSSLHWDNEEHSFIDIYLKQRGWRETPYGRRYLQAINDTDIQLWEITDVKPGFYADVRPYGSTKKSVRVIEKSGTETLNQWDCIAGRVVKLDNTYLFTGAILPLPPAEAESVSRVVGHTEKEVVEIYKQLIADGEINELPDDLEQIIDDDIYNELPKILFRVWITYLYKTINQDMPTLSNKDGDIFQIAKVRFPVLVPPKKLLQAIKEIPELEENHDSSGWNWLPHTREEQLPDNEFISVLGQLSLQEKSLTLEVNSTDRAETGSLWLSEKLGNLIGKPLTIIDNIADSMENAILNNEDMDFPELENADELMNSFMQQHYQKILDEPIPMLNDKTPRECAANPKLHKDVVKWIKYMENQDAKTPTPDFDFSWVWVELGLEKYK